MPPKHDTLESTVAWFEAAVPSPTLKNIHTQVGVHYEEVTEMTACLKGKDRMTQSLLTQAMLANHALAMHLKTNSDCLKLAEIDAIELLDSLCDQTVTGAGVSHMMGYEHVNALAEVNSSNWSKFDDNKPLFDENGKIIKSKFYRKANLEPFV